MYACVVTQGCQCFGEDWDRNLISDPGQVKRDKLSAAVKAMKESPGSVQVQTQGCKDIITFGTDTAAAQV